VVPPLIPQVLGTKTYGDLIKTSNSSAVYFMDAAGKKHLFPNSDIFWSWYSGDWSGVKFGNTTLTVATITMEQFNNISEANHVKMRAGLLVKFTNSPRIYVASNGGKLHKLESATVAETLFGTDWSKKIKNVQPGFSVDYDTAGTALTSTSAYPDGALIKWTGSVDTYYISGGLKRLINSANMVANGFVESNVRTAPATISYTAGAAITTAEAVLTTVAGGL
ncbi:MAG: hypothetical protein AAB791_01270, partial [Patescibacteria group bacterium]